MKTATISAKGQIAIPKEVREVLHIKEGDQFAFEITEEGKIIMEPRVNIPRSQAWFWTKEVQEKIVKAEKNFKRGDYKTYDPGKLIKELEDRD